MSTVLWLGAALLLGAIAFAVLGLRLGHPHHRKLSFGIWGLSWIPLAISAAHHQAQIEARVEVVESALSGYEMHLGLLLLLGLIGYLGRVLFPTEPGVTRELEQHEMARRVDADLAQLRYLFDKVERVTDEVVKSGIVVSRAHGLSAHDSALLRTLWARFVETAFELEILKSHYRAFYSVSPVSRREVHARCFLVAYAAYVAEYRAGMLLTAWVDQNATLQTVLNEANPAHDLPADTLLELQRQSMHPDTVLRLNAGRAYLKLQREQLSSQPIFERVRGFLHDIDAMLETNPDIFIDNPLDYLERVAFDLWFPIQKNVTRGISALHLPLREHFIGAEALTAAAAELEPGDILLLRREWHLTNLGIPGYWTHAAVYTAAPQVIDRYFAGLEWLGGQSASAWLAERQPVTAAQLHGTDEQGHPMAVIEAVTAGVKASSLETAGSGDALGVLRPNIDRSDKLRAIENALSHVGKPYDYNFDLATDNELVCSELVYKAYEGACGMQLEPSELHGRLMLSPNAICEKFDAEYTDDHRQLDHALFLDGVEVGRVVSRGPEALRESWRRPKWHILLADAHEQGAAD